MVWNWQQFDWPDFAYDSASLAPLESRLLHESGLLFGAFAHLDDSEQRALTVDLIGDEALMTARIEGESLDRNSL
jgi:Fic family protein